MNKKQTVILWILGISSSFFFILFGLWNSNVYSLEGLLIKLLMFLFIVFLPFTIILGILFYSFRDKNI